jgi:hypothetical protein
VLLCAGYNNRRVEFVDVAAIDPFGLLTSDERCDRQPIGGLAFRPRSAPGGEHPAAPPPDAGCARAR